MNTRAQKQEDKRAATQYQVVKLRCEGKTYGEIGKLLGCSDRNASFMMARARARFYKGCNDELKEAERAELERLNDLDAESEAAWERSQRNAVRRETTTFETEDGPTTQTKKIVTGQVGDPRFLSEMRHLSAERRSLLGLDKEKHTGSDTEAPAIRIVVVDTREQAQQMVTFEERQKQIVEGKVVEPGSNGHDGNGATKDD